MSKAIIQSVTLLSCVAGLLEASRTKRGVSELSYKFLSPYIDEAEEAVMQALNKWERAKDEHKQFSTIVDTVKSWEDNLISRQAELSVFVVIHVALNIVSDLDSVIKNGKKKALLDGIFKPLNKASDFLDYEGVRGSELRYADVLLNFLYIEIGFTIH